MSRQRENAESNELEFLGMSKPRRQEKDFSFADYLVPRE